MKSLSKILFIALIGTFVFSSCGNDELAVEDKGIKIITTRNSGEADGIGIACNFKDIIKEAIKQDVDSLDTNDKDFFEQIFGSLDQTMYGIIAGEEAVVKEGFGVEFEGEAFSLFWFSDGAPTPGTYEAKGTKFNVENPEDLEKGAEDISGGTIMITLESISDETMQGTFAGTFKDKDGEEEEVSGSFNVDRKPCTD